MKLDVAFSNGPACISAEWIHELNIWEHECAYTDDCLPMVTPLFIAPHGPRSLTTPATLDSHPIAGPLATGAQAALLI